MGKIFCLMGKSSSGKDTIFKEIRNIKELNLNPIVLYTTRPKRINETNGVEYFFINKDKLKQYENEGKIIECRKYDTVDGPWYYSTIDDGQIDLKQHNYIVIVTLEAYNSFKNYFGIEKVYPIYINIEDRVRLERALTREIEEKNPNYNELCRRFLADSSDFSSEKLKESNVNKEYINIDLQKCIENIVSDIKREMQS
ncbi:MAG: guanylate kinase [Clostridium sp.]|nr:guanylate kinase [Clostridium sp.]